MPGYCGHDLPGDAIAFIRERVRLSPTVGVVLGSGLGALVDRLDSPTVLRYGDIPHWPRSAVPGHAGALCVGILAGTPAAVAAGRHHFYESGDLEATVFGTRVLAGLGCRTLIVTNAAGGIRPDLLPGSLMLIRDHINLPGLAGWNPLIGLASPSGEPHFQPMTGAYSPRLRELAVLAAAEFDIAVSEGIFAMVAGPSYETPAEVRALHALGADAVGMSTAAEVVVARALGLEVLGISCITNRAADEDGLLGHEGVIAAAAAMTERLNALVQGIIAHLDPATR